MILKNKGEQIVAIDSNGNEVPVQFGPSVISGQLGIPVYSDDANAPTETQYFNDADGLLKFKDADGTVHEAGMDSHALGGSDHESDTLSNLNSLISDATLDDETSTRPPESHALGGSAHGSDTLANLNALISDATLDGDSSARPPETHDNSAHSATFVSDGDGTTRQIWVISNGASDPSGAAAEDIIFEEQA